MLHKQHWSSSRNTRGAFYVLLLICYVDVSSGLTSLFRSAEIITTVICQSQMLHRPSAPPSARSSLFELNAWASSLLRFIQDRSLARNVLIQNPSILRPLFLFPCILKSRPIILFNSCWLPHLAIYSDPNGTKSFIFKAALFALIGVRWCPRCCRRGNYIYIDNCVSCDSCTNPKPARL